MNIFPTPKSLKFIKSKASKPQGVHFELTSSLKAQLSYAGTSLSFVEKAFNGDGAILLVQNEQDCSLGREEYILTVTEGNAIVKHSAAAGFYYAMQTLVALAEKDEWGTAHVHDAPAISLRGALLDIGRDKIPTMETLYSYIDMFSLLRYNHIELYMEGYCFEYPEYKHLFSDSTPITSEEFVLLSRYSAARFIDLVPNQNCLGHMDQWLAKPSLRDLAECPDGFLHQNLYMRPPMTLNTNDKKVDKLVEYFLQKLLPNFSGEYVNINADEPFELGRGKNKELCDKVGLGQIYLDYILKMHEMCASYGKKIMLWGDVVFNHPEIIDKLPEDAILLDWIYEGDASFKNHCLALEKAKCEFCLCPGTSSWASFAGRSDNAVKNINDAVENAVKYNAKGVIITDWGDMGHWQYFTVSKPIFAACGLAMWTGEQVDNSLVKNITNNKLFNDESNTIYDIIFNLGNYYKLENSAIYNATLSFSLMCNKYTFNNKEEFDAAVVRLIKLCENIAHENSIIPTITGINPDYVAIEKLLSRTEQDLKGVCLNCSDAATIVKEIEMCVKFIRHGLKLYKTMSEYNFDTKSADFTALKEDIEKIYAEHYKLWMKRNRSGGFSRSSAHLNHLIGFYQKEAAL